MKPYLNAGFGDPIGIADLLLIQQLGFYGVRQDLPEGREEVLIREFADPRVRLRPLFIVNGGKMPYGPEHAGTYAVRVAQEMRVQGVSGEIEIGNEPNISHNTYRDKPSDLTLSVVTAFNIMQDHGLADTKLVVGGIMNTDKRGLAYLHEVMKGMPAKVIVGYHTYRQHDKPSKPSKGFATRGAEFRALNDIVAGREIWNTEIGWHTAKEKKHCWSRKTGLSDEEVFERLKEEAAFNRRAGAKVFTVFQLNDGLDSSYYENCFGIRTADRQILKPSAQIAQWVNA